MRNWKTETISSVDADSTHDAPAVGQSIMGKKLFAPIRPAGWFGVFAGFLLVGAVEGAPDPLVVHVWPGAIPKDFGAIGPERLRASGEAPTKDAKWITNVTRPTISVFRPAADKNTGTAVVICPGGGYWNLAWDLEGEEVAGAENSLLMYQALKRAGVAAELHVYAQGGHGFGVRPSNHPCSTWTDRCVAWMHNQGMLGTHAQAGSDLRLPRSDLRLPTSDLQ
jgi:hypothetical protein